MHRALLTTVCALLAVATAATIGGGLARVVTQRARATCQLDYATPTFELRRCPDQTVWLVRQGTWTLQAGR